MFSRLERNMELTGNVKSSVVGNQRERVEMLQEHVFQKFGSKAMGLCSIPQTNIHPFWNSGLFQRHSIMFTHPEIWN